MADPTYYGYAGSGRPFDQIPELGGTNYHLRRIRAALSDPMLDEAMMLDQVNAILDETLVPPTPQPIAAVGEEPLEPLVSTATVARRRHLPEDELRAELAEAQRSTRFWRGQAENWEREHQNTVLPYTTKVENERDALRAQLDRVRAIAEEAPEPRGALRRRLLTVLDSQPA
jgi:hypothetical protein